MSHSDQGWGKQLTRPCVGRQPLLALGLGQLCGPCLWPGQGERKASGRQEQEFHWLGCQLPPHLRAWDSWFLLMHNPQFPPSGHLPPTSLPSLRARPCPVGKYPLRPESTTPESGSAGGEDRDREAGPDVWKKSKSRNKKRTSWLLAFEPLSSCVKIISFVCSSVSLSVGKIQRSHRLVLIITVCK